MGAWSKVSRLVEASLTIGIQLLNEPRLEGDFTMTLLKSFYNQGEDIIAPFGLNTTAHGEFLPWSTLMTDAFWGPTYWSDFNPSAPEPRRNFTLDTHQYYAFPPLNDLPHETILDSICNISQILHSDSIPPTIVGEWSLESGQPPNSSTTWRGREGSQEKRTWQRLFFEAQLAAYSPSAEGQAVLGWYYWTCESKTCVGTDKKGRRNGISIRGHIDEALPRGTFRLTCPTRRLSPFQYSRMGVLMRGTTTRHLDVLERQRGVWHGRSSWAV